MRGTPENKGSSRDGDGGLENNVEAARASRVRRELRTPRAAAVAGILFSVLLTMSMAFMKLSIPDNPADAGRWMAEGGHSDLLVLSLNLIPFAGIAFLWFIGVIRDRMGKREDKFFATVFLGSGLLFVAMLFAATAIAVGLALSFRSVPEAVAESHLWRFGREAIYAAVNIYAMRMAAVFIISATTLALRTGFLSRWLIYLGYAIAIVLLVTISFEDWMVLLFPLWVLLVSLEILVRTMREGRRTPAGPAAEETA